MRIGIIGQSGSISEDLYRLSAEVGREIAMRGAVLFSGGTNGVMEAASRGAKQAGGLVVGILPGDTLDRANDYIDIPITTGLSFDFRSLILVHSSDAIVMIGGGNGTLGELSAAYMNCKPVIVLEPSGGWAERVRTAAYDGCYLDERKTVAIQYASTPQEAIDLVYKLALPCEKNKVNPVGTVDGIK